MSDDDKRDEAAKGKAGDGTGDDAKRAAEAAKADAKAAGAQARKAEEGVADTARRNASEMATEATEKAQELAATASEQLQGAVERQKAEGAERAHRIAQAIERAGDDLGEEIPVVGDYVRRAAHEIDTLADAVRERDPAELLGVAQDFARRQPALFAGVTGLVGFAAVRFLTASAPAGGTASGSDYGGQRTIGSDSKSDLDAALAPGGSEAPASGDPGGVAPGAPGFGTSATKTTEGGPSAKGGS